MIYLAAAVSLGLFVWSLSRFRAIEVAGDALAAAKDAMANLLDPTLSDADKERAARASSLQLLVHAATIAGRLAIAMAIPLAFLGAMIGLRLLNFAPLVAVLESWRFVVLSTIVVVAALLWRR